MGNYPSTLLYHFGDLLQQPTTETRTRARYGWYPDVPDRRDAVVSHYPTDSDDEHIVHAPSNGEPPTEPPPDILRVDLRTKFPGVYDDEGLGCSTVSALAALVEYHELRVRPHTSYEPSRLCWYYLIREARGTERADAGASFREAFKVLSDEGVCDEIDWPFDTTMYASPPEWATYESTPRSRPAVYKRVPQTLDALKHCLAQDKPVAFGLSVYDSFESSVTRRTGKIALPGCAHDLVPPTETTASDTTEGTTPTTNDPPTPQQVDYAEDADPVADEPMGTNDDPHLGGHALVLVGYDDTEQTFVVRNSQGVSWGANGYGYIPYAYVLNAMLARDFWVVHDDAPPSVNDGTHEASVPEEEEVYEEAVQDESVDADGKAAVETKACEREERTEMVTHDTDSTDSMFPPLFRELLDRVGK